MSYNVQPNVANPDSSRNFLIYSAGVAQVQFLTGVIDQIPEEQHTIEVGITQYPIETGATLTDHVFIKPRKLTLTGYVSDILIPVTSAIRGPFRDTNAWQVITNVIQARERLQVTTLLATYPNMVLTSVSAPKNVNSGRGLIVTLSFTESLVADTKLVKLPVAQLAGAATNKSGTVNGGEKQSSTATTDQLDTFTDSLSGISYSSGSLADF